MKENRPKSTAFTVLQGILYTAKQNKYKHLISEDVIKTSKQISMSSAEGQKRLAQLDNPVFNFVIPFTERLLMPGITLHYVLRKKFIEECVIKAIESGMTQIINFGAGFDTLAWVLHKQYPHVNFIEIDHPVTISEKNKALPQDEISNFNLFPIDFTKKKLVESLNKFPNFAPKRPTLFLCEGVLMYLTQLEVKQLLTDIKNLTGKGSCLVFTCVEPMNSPKNNTGKLLEVYLEFKGEALNWSMKNENLEFFLEDCGYKLEDLATSETFKSRYLIKTEQLHKGEYIAVARVR